MTESAPALTFHSRRKFWIKTTILATATVALIPILLLQNELASFLYVAFLAVVHVAGLVIFAIGVKREDIAPTARGLWTRLLGIGIAVWLLYLVSHGLRTDTQSLIFWGSLFAIWLIHTAALALLHIRGRAEEKACPFV